jgi:hypothetical protein
MDATNIISMAERLGVSFAFLVLILYFFAKATYWFGDKVIIPLTSKHISFIDRLEVALEKVVDTQVELTKSCKQILNNTRVDLPVLETRNKEQKKND